MDEEDLIYIANGSIHWYNHSGKPLAFIQSVWTQSLSWDRSKGNSRAPRDWPKNSHSSSIYDGKNLPNDRWINALLYLQTGILTNWKYYIAIKIGEPQIQAALQINIYRKKGPRKNILCLFK